MGCCSRMFMKLVLVLAMANVAQSTVEDQARAFLKRIDDNATVLVYDYTRASWEYNTNITTENSDKASEKSAIWSSYYTRASEEASTYDIKQINDSLIKLQLIALQDKGSGALPQDKREQLNKLMNEMSTIYSTATVCKMDDPFDCQTLEPGLESVMANSTDYYERLHVWEGWRVEVGKKMRPLYEGYVDLKNEAARLNGYADYGDYWRSNYETIDEGQYNYSRDELIDDVRKIYKEGWDVRRMFDEAEKFFMSVNLFKLFDNFWSNSMLEKPTDRKVVCHPTAWDMGNREDYRIKMCSKVNMDDFLTVHHELGHIQYNMAYRDLPYLLRDGANEGFHEAVGEIMSLSAATPKHLKALGLLPASFKDDQETEINFLLKQALSIVATLPFTYMLEEWRWQVFQGNIPKDEWMLRWWEMKRDMVGVVEPLPRDETYCDPPALYHVSSDFSFIRYFTRTIYQFQFQDSLCQAAGHSGPLFKCDITNSTAAGNKLKAMLVFGKSQSWTRALEQVSGVTRMDSKPLRDYFSMLHDWLVKENQKNNVKPGWRTSVDPYSANAYKVRLSLQAAMGNEAYPWNKNEMYLFKTTIAYAMRQYYTFEKGQQVNFMSENVHTYKETPRISFYFVVTDPANSTKTIPKAEVEAAIRLSRGRINSAFLLSDGTLEFEGLLATMSPPSKPAVETWLILFGVVMAIAVCMGVIIIVTGFLNRKRKSKRVVEDDQSNESESQLEGVTNKSFEDDDGEQTGL